MTPEQEREELEAFCKYRGCRLPEGVLEDWAWHEEFLFWRDRAEIAREREEKLEEIIQYATTVIVMEEDTWVTAQDAREMFYAAKKDAGL